MQILERGIDSLNLEEYDSSLDDHIKRILKAQVDKRPVNKLNWIASSIDRLFYNEDTVKPRNSNLKGLLEKINSKVNGLYGFKFNKERRDLISMFEENINRGFKDTLYHEVDFNNSLFDLDEERIHFGAESILDKEQKQSLKNNQEIERDDVHDVMNNVEFGLKHLSKSYFSLRNIIDDYVDGFVQKGEFDSISSDVLRIMHFLHGEKLDIKENKWTYRHEQISNILENIDTKDLSDEKLDNLIDQLENLERFTDHYYENSYSAKDETKNKFLEENKLENYISKFKEVRNERELGLSFDEVIGFEEEIPSVLPYPRKGLIDDLKIFGSVGLLTASLALPVEDFMSTIAEKSKNKSKTVFIENYLSKIGVPDAEDLFLKNDDFDYGFTFNGKKYLDYDYATRFIFNEHSKLNFSSPNIRILESIIEMSDVELVSGLQERIEDVKDYYKNFHTVPVDNSFWITRGIGWHDDPVQLISENKRERRYHAGHDLVTKNWRGSIISTADGRGVQAGYDRNGYGHYLKVKSDNVIVLYSHLPKTVRHLVDVEIKRGEEISKSIGKSGYTTNPNLHLGIIEYTEDNRILRVNPVRDHKHLWIPKELVSNAVTDVLYNRNLEDSRRFRKTRSWARIDILYGEKDKLVNASSNEKNLSGF
ncbi:hypothetical protein CL617_03060 [archaeon]|nr:hypothetical protein [archaeon]|tara:strand:- start:19220 stop:21169 length:1950 start_codon:yes stop_codon:yes gene_type:complete